MSEQLQFECMAPRRGTFDILVQADAQGNIVGMFKHWCPNRNAQCGVAIIKGDPKDWRHGWNGDFERPTITPSIGCDTPPRCGWHGHIINGVRTP